MGISAEHCTLCRNGERPDWARVEGKRTTSHFLQTGEDFIALVGDGLREDRRRVYTYALTDDGLFFSETGANMSKDMISKHAVHANANPAVRSSGTFRVCVDGKERVVVLDNDSGTYRPSGEAVAKLASLLKSCFVGLQTRGISVLEPQ